MAKGKLTKYIEQKLKTLSLLQEHVDNIIENEPEERKIQSHCINALRYLQLVQDELNDALNVSNQKGL
jgi:hypothetical protein